MAECNGLSPWAWMTNPTAISYKYVGILISILRNMKGLPDTYPKTGSQPHVLRILPCGTDYCAISVLAQLIQAEDMYSVHRSDTSKLVEKCGNGETCLENRYIIGESEARFQQHHSHFSAFVISHRVLLSKCPAKTVTKHLFWIHRARTRGLWFARSTLLCPSLNGKPCGAGC